MLNKLIKHDEGFTLIEIVMVLAIAGLIMVIVFLAVSGAQKSRRDTARRSDLNRMSAGLESSASNNNGVYPTDAATLATFVTSYFSAQQDPGGSTYTITYDATAATAPAVGTILYGTGLKCTNPYTPASPRIASAGTRNYAAVLGLEQGTTYCRDNQ